MKLDLHVDLLVGHVRVLEDDCDQQNVRVVNADEALVVLRLTGVGEGRWDRLDL